MGKVAAVEASSASSFHRVFFSTYETRNSLIDHCKKEFPIEACGILSGKNGIACTVWPIKNQDHSAVSFSMSIRDITNVFNLIEEKNEEVLAIYHSHPTTSAYPSSGDIRYNNYPELAHIIVSLNKPLPEVKAFKIKGAQVTSLTMQLVKSSCVFNRGV